MQDFKAYPTQTKQKDKSHPKIGMFFVYLVLGLSLCVFGASIWFSSYSKRVYLRREPIFSRKQNKIQYEIQQFELKENVLTDVERIRKITGELGLVEYTGESIELPDR